MNTVKFSLLYNLASAEYFKNTNSEAEKLFHNLAMEIYKSNLPFIHTQVREMIDEGLITNLGTLTFKGKLYTITNIFEYGPNHLGIETNKHIRECLRRDVLKTSIKGGKGVLSHLRNEEISALLSDLLDECFDRVQNGTQAIHLVNESSAAYIVELNESIEKELTVISGSNEVVDIQNEVIVEVEAIEEKPKKTKKAKVKA